MLFYKTSPRFYTNEGLFYPEFGLSIFPKNEVESKNYCQRERGCLDRTQVINKNKVQVDSVTCDELVKTGLSLKFIL